MGFLSTPLLFAYFMLQNFIFKYQIYDGNHMNLSWIYKMSGRSFMSCAKIRVHHTKLH